MQDVSSALFRSGISASSRPRGSVREEFVLAPPSCRPAAEADARRRVVADQGRQVEVFMAEHQAGFTAFASVDHDLLLSSIFSGQMTAPRRQVPSQIRSFSRHSSESSSTRLPLPTPRSFRNAGNVGDELIEFAETDRRLLVEIDDRGLARIARRGTLRQQLGDRPVRQPKLVISENIRHDAASSHAVHSSFTALFAMCDGVHSKVIARSSPSSAVQPFSRPRMSATCPWVKKSSSRTRSTG